jgi:hypothetical protein
MGGRDSFPVASVVPRSVLPVNKRTGDRIMSLPLCAELSENEFRCVAP